MLKTRVIPCLLIKEGKLVKTVRFKNPSYVGDPINAIKIYNEKEVDELILLDITATLEGREPPFELLEEVADECFMPVCYGGGIRGVDQVRRIFNLGIEKVAINSFAAEQPEFITEAAELFGRQSIVLSLDVRKTFLGKYGVRTHSGRKAANADPVAYARKMEALGVGEVLLYAMHRDGTWQGYDVELIKAVSEAVSVPVIACGGAGCMDHLGPAVAAGGASALALGSMAVYQGKDLGVLINFPSRHDIETMLEA